MKTTLYLFSFISLGLLLSCDPSVDTHPDCIGENAPCEGFSFSLIDILTHENLIGEEGQLIHPDSVYILNMAGEQMRGSAKYFELLNWYSVEYFSPYQEIACLNQCAIDSAFSRYYYVYVGNDDWDTLEVHFNAPTNYATDWSVYYNNSKPVDPYEYDLPAFSSYVFLINKP